MNDLTVLPCSLSKICHCNRRKNTILLFRFSPGQGHQEAAKSTETAMETEGSWVAEESVNEEQRVELRESLEAWNKTRSTKC